MKKTININGTKIVIDTNNPKVADAVAELVKACVERQFKIGDVFTHRNGVDYMLIKVGVRGYLVNLNGKGGKSQAGRVRNSRKVVLVQGDPPNGYYVTDLPDETDHFYDPDSESGAFLTR